MKYLEKFKHSRNNKLKRLWGTFIMCSSHLEDFWIIYNISHTKCCDPRVVPYKVTLEDICFWCFWWKLTIYSNLFSKTGPPDVNILVSNCLNMYRKSYWNINIFDSFFFTKRGANGQKDELSDFFTSWTAKKNRNVD